MDVVLLTLTTLSLAAAAGFAVMSWRIGREEQERSRARVTALATSLAPPRPADAINPGHATGRVAVGSVFDRNEQGIAGRPALKFAVVVPLYDGTAAMSQSGSIGLPSSSCGEAQH